MKGKERTLILPIHIDLLLCFIKLYLCYATLKFFGIILGIGLVVTFFNVKDILFKYIFKLEKLCAQDLIFTGFDNKDRYNMMCIFFFDSECNLEEVKKNLIENGIKKNAKLRVRLV